MSTNIEIRPVLNSRDLRRFIDVPWHIYANDDDWIPPLRLERRLHLSRLNPYFEHGEWQAWIAYKGGLTVGRICAQVDKLHRRCYGNDTGHFGLLEADDDATVFHALIQAAEQWLANKNTKQITGPFNMSINQECGLLVDGFDSPPVLMMPHGRPWYGRLLEEQGYRPAKDLLAYWVNVDFDAPNIMRSLLKRYKNKIKLRTLNRKQLSGELEILRSIFNDAWSENWGFVPFTRAEFAELGTSLRLFVPDAFVQIAEVDNVPVAFIAALPNLNEIFKYLNGRLLPFGWFKLLQALKGRQITTGRVPLMGVRKRFQNRPLGIALAFQVIEAVRRELFAGGIREVEMSWILDDNKGMIDILDSIGSRLYKRYRIYQKTIA